MYRSVILSAVFLFLGYTARANTVTVAEELVIPVPNGWEIGADTMQFPVKLTKGDSAEVLLFRSVISEDEAISTQAGLKASVDQVIKEVILTLPESRLLSSTGFDRPPVIGFSVEFVSLDTLIFLEVNHQLSAIVYRLEDGSQVMFTIWGKATIDQLPTVRYAVNSIRNNLEYLGPHEENAFAFSMTDYYVPGLMLVACVGLLLLVRSRAQQRARKIEKSPDRFWRCLCGRLNGHDQPGCRRCGRSPDDRTENESSPGVDEDRSHRS